MYLIEDYTYQATHGIHACGQLGAPTQAKRSFILLKSIMLPVLMLFLLPVGGGIPAGVLLASSHGLAWPITAGLYLASDLILALTFEPILRLFVTLGKRISFL